MGIEYETQVLDINPKKIAEKLRKLGAKEEAETLMKRWTFEINCSRDGEFGKGKDKWVRLRETNGKTKLTYKSRESKEVAGTEEIEVEVSDFDKAAKILSKLSCFKEKYYQENKIHTFRLNEIEFGINIWPKIPPALEIEAKSEEKVKEGLRLLGLEGKDVGHLGWVKVYFKYGLDLHSFKELKFE